MCYSRRRHLSEDRRADQAGNDEASRQKRAGVIDALLSDAKERGQAAKPRSAPVENAVPTKQD